MIKAFLLIGMMIFGVQSIAQNYVQVTNTSGSGTYYGISTAVTTTGATSTTAACGTNVGPYLLNGIGSYTFTFSAPVGSVIINAAFLAGGAETIHFQRNGVTYAITGGNLGGTVGTCASGTLAVAASGDLSNTGNTGTTPNNSVIIPGPINSITISTTTSVGAQFGLLFTPSSYFQVLNGFGSSVVDGVTTTVTSSGDIMLTTPCPTNLITPYVVGNGAPSGIGEFDFAFSPAPDGIIVPSTFSGTGINDAIHYKVNGSGVTLTSVTNIDGIVSPNCGDNTLATIVAGDLSNVGDNSGDPSALVALNGPVSTYSLANTVAGNAAAVGLFITKGATSAMTFDNTSPQTVSICGSSATSINSQLSVTDLNSNSLTLVWSIAVAPSHGTLAGFPATGTTTGASVTPTGLTYTATGGYTGTDGYTIQVTDGVNVATTNVVLTIGSSTDVSSFATSVPVNPCQGTSASVTINSTSLTAGTYTVTYNLSGANAATGNTASVTMASNTGTFTTSALASTGSTTVTITGITGSCGTVPVAAGNTATFTVNSAPPALSVPGPVCANGSTIFVSDGTSGGTYSTAGSLFTFSGGTTGVTTVTGVSAGTSNITYTLSGCYQTAAITVLAAPSAISGSNTVCTGSSAPYPTGLSSSPSGGTWGSSNTFVATVSSTGVVTGLTAGPVTISYSLGDGCYSLQPMTVNTTPPALTGTTFTVCTGSLITLADGTSGGLFTSTNSGQASINSSTGVVTGNMAGNPTISYTVPNGCAVTQQLTVNTTPPALSGPTSMCVGSSTTYTDITTGGNWTSSNTMLLTIGLSTGIANAVAPGAPTITYTVPNGCFVTQLVNVNPNPVAITTTAPSFAVCTGSTITVNDATGSGSWSSNNPGLGSVDAVSGVVTGNSTGVPLISYTLATGCYATQAVSVNQTPVATTGNSQVCIGLTTTLTNTTGGGSWSASNSNASVTSAGVVTGLLAGSVTISYVMPTGCYALFPMTVNSNPNPLGGPTAVCVGATIVATETTPGPATWSSNNTSQATVTGGTITGVGAGNPIISYLVTSTGCYATETITVNANPSAITGTTSICTGLSQTLTSSPAGGTWTSSNGNATVGASSGTVTGASFGTSNISYALGTGCYAFTTVTINPLPAAIGGSPNVCIGATTTLTDGGGGLWSSSNSTQASVGAGTGIVSGLTAGSPTITYTLPTGCLITQVVNVNSNPAAIAGTTSACVNGTAVLSDGTGGGTWSSSNTALGTVIASGSGAGTVTGISAGTFTISYGVTATTTCYATTSFTVNPLPAAIAGTLSVCTGGTTALTDATGGGAWSSGDITKATISSSTGVATGAMPGNVVITYLLGTGCSTTANLTVNQTPASITGTTSICAGSGFGSTTVLSDATTPAGTWSSSNTALGTVVATGAGAGTVTGIATGVPTITYTMATGCYTTTLVTVNPLPAAIAGSPVVCVGANVLLTDATSGGGWTSSNGLWATVGASTGIVTGVGAGNPVITYALPTGCIAVVTATVNPLPAGITGTNNVCTGFTTTLSDASAGGTWSSSDVALGSISGLATANPVTIAGVAAGVPTISYSLPTGCAVTTPLTVNQTPAVITGTLNVCVGNTTTLADATSAGIWTSTTSAASVGAGTGTVTGVSAGFPNISYTAPNGCSVGTTFTVNPLPAGITGPTSVCIGQTITLADATTGGSWTSSNSAEGTVSAGVSTTTTLGGIAAGTPLITYTLATGCITTTPVTVNPNPAAITGTLNVCTGFTTTLADATSGGTWSSNNGAQASVGASTGIVTGTGPGNPTITYALPTGCLTTAIITVNQTPAAIAGITNVCVGLVTSLTDATTGGTWSSSNTASGTVSSTGGVYGVAAGVPVISYAITATGCYVTTPVTVNANPAAITGLNTVCTGSTIGLGDATSGGSWTSSDPTRASVTSGTGVVTGNLAGTPIITYALSTGCQATYPITVNTTPAAITGSAPVCTGYNITVADATIGGAWTSSNTSEATVTSSGAGTATVTGVGVGTPNISYTISGCSVTTPVVVNQTPVATTGTPNVCVGSTTVLSDATAGGNWFSTNTAQATVGLTSGVVTGVNAGNPNISYTITSTGCYYITPITVNPTPAAVTGPGVVCVGSNITMADATSGGIWSSGNVSTATINAATGVVTGVAAGSVAITYTLGGLCTASTTITVNPVPNISNFTSTVATSECVGLGGTVTVSSTSLGSGTFTVTYNLSGANAVTGATATLTMGATNGTFSIPSSSLTVTGFTTVTITGISNSFSCTSVPLSSNASTFSVYPLPTVYTVTGGGSYCVGGTGVHVYLSNSVGGINYQLWLGSTAVGAPVAGTFSGLDFGAITTVGTYSVTATNATTGCSSNMFGTATVTTNPLPVSTYTVTGGGSYCAGGTGVNVGLSNSQSGISYQLFVGSVSTGSAVLGSGAAISFGLQTTAGTYTVVGTNTTTLCTSNMTGSQAVVINPLPAAITGTMFVCPGTTTTLSDATASGVWSSTTSTIATVGSATGVVTGVAAGTSSIVYTLPTGCSISTVVTVNPLPAAISGLTSVCTGSAITLTNSTGGGNWSSSNTLLATVGVTSGIVTGVGAGTPTITYTLSTGCFTTFNITVNQTPVAITGTPNVCTGQTTTLTDATTGGTWSSSNSTVASIVSTTGVISGLISGTVTVTYAMTVGGCSATIPFTVNPTPAAITGASSVCVGLTTTLADASSGGTWGSSNTSVATVNVSSGVVTGVSAGAVSITYALPAGCFVVIPMTVNPTPPAITGTNNVCVGLTTPLADATTGGTWSSSNTLVATVNSSTGVVTGAGAGSANIVYTLTAGGCNVVFPFTVNPLPLAITGTNNVCVGLNTTLNDGSAGGLWTSSNTSIASIGSSSGTVTGGTPGSVTITYTLPTGCLITAPFTVNPLPAAISGISTMCAGSSVTLSDAGGGTWGTSNGAVASVGSTTGVVTGTGAGTATITYTLPTGCLITTPVTVYPAPVAISGSNTVCVGLTTALSDGTSGGTWSSSNISLATIGTSGIVMGVAPGTPTITYTLPAPGSCTATLVISVNPQPAGITGTTTMCAGSTTNLFDATTGGVWSTSNGAIAAVGTSTGIVTGASPGTATITYTLPAGCFVTTPVTVYTTPAPITGSNNVCVGSTVILSDANSGGTWSTTSTQASVGGTTGIVTGISAGTPVITYTLLPGSCTAFYAMTVNPLPSAITGVASVCAGNTTTLSDASAGGSWTSGNTIVATIGSTSGVVSGATPGTSLITYTLPTGCIITATVTVNALPNIYSLTGGGTYCTGGTGSVVGLSSSDAGVNYQLYIGGVATGTPVAGTGTAISFGSQTAAGTYTAIATNATTSCVNSMGGSATITVSVLPTVFSITGGGGYCAGGTGVAVGLGNSTTGVNYQLYLGTLPVGAPVAGTTGSSISFGLITAAGTYTVIATNASTGCTSTMGGAASVTVNPLPTSYSVTGGGSYCIGGTGVHIGLINSQVGVNYTLSSIGTMLPGTGSALDFGLVTTVGASYTVSAVNATTSCTATMLGSAAVSTNTLPTVYGISPTGVNAYCVGGTGISITLANTQTGVFYQLYNAGSAAGTPIAGTTGLPITFPATLAPGRDSVVAISASTGCMSTMTGITTVTINPLPALFTVSGGGSYCSGGSGVFINLSGSATGYTYQLYNGTSSSGSAILGTGAAISTPSAVTAAGTYTIVARNTTTTCTVNMTGSATVSVSPLPNLYTVSPSGSGSYCAGTASTIHVLLSSSDAGISYQLYNGSSVVGTPIVSATTGSSLDFGAQPASVTSYSVVATNPVTLCTNTMVGGAFISTYALPAAFTVTGGGSYCAGGAGDTIKLNGSSTGVTYRLFNGSVIVDSLLGTTTPLNFGAYTAAGIYSVTATSIATGCVNTMTGTPVVSVTSAPVVNNVLGTGSYCAGGAGLPVTLDGSVSGVNYQLYNSGTAVGFPVPGTSSPLSLGTQTIPGTYTVVATNVATGCTATMAGSAVISVNPAPTATYSVTGGGSYCTGGIGVLVGLSGSDTGVSYQLYNGTATAGLAMIGTGSAISFGNHISVGIRTVIATRISTGCTATMTGSVTITINPVPAIHAVIGGGAYCPGGTGRTIGLDGSNTGINYQLSLAGTPAGPVVAGTNIAISFGLQTALGTYSVQAINATTGCTSLMTGTAVISNSALPTAFAVTGTGGYCLGGTGISVGLGTTQTSTNYQLYLGSATVGVPVAGTGSSISFPPQTILGTYTVVATNTVTGCSSNMAGSAIISLNPLPIQDTVTGGGGYCAGGAGLAIGLSSSTASVSYQLFNGLVSSGPALAGTGSAISFGLQTATGSYTVVATNSVTGCVNNMRGSASITINPLPNVYLITQSSSTYCAGGTGVHIGLSTSDAGINYQLNNGGVAVGGIVAGIGSPLDFGLETAAGNYTVVATNAVTSCTSSMSGTATVSINPVPVSTYAVTGGGSYCAGGVGLSVGLSGSNSGINYQLYNGGTAVGSLVAGTSSPLGFGLQTAAGTYTVGAANATTGCTSMMTGSTSVTVNPLPIIDTVTGGGNYCPGGSGNHIGLSGSTSGINYQLFRGVTPLAIVPGTGAALDFGLQTIVGTYFVTANNPATGCSSNMVGSPAIGISALPTAHILTASATGYCLGGIGVVLSLDGSDIGSSYQLYLGSLPVGVPISGTGFPLSYGLHTSAGTYSIIATSAATTCSSTMSGTPSVTINTPPAAYTVTGGGGFCAGGTGVPVFLANSDPGVSYQLYNGATPSGSPVAGTGFSLSFGPITASGSYTVIATTTATGCSSTMLSSAAVSANPLPVAYYVVGGGSYCSGTSGLHVGINGSDSGISYQLYLGTTAVGIPLAGTGIALDFGSQTIPGVYRVVATNGTTTCTQNMLDSAVLSISPSPTAFAVTGGGNYCIGGTGVHVGLVNSFAGINYTLWNGASAIVSGVAGTGTALDFGLVTAAGTYTVTAANPATGCTNSMSGSAVVTISPLPAVHSVTGGGSYCASTTGLAIGLNPSDIGVNYQLYNDGAAVGGLVAGTSGAISFGLHTAGSYTVVAINATTSCTSDMTGTAIVTTMASVVPSVTVSTGVGDTVCSGASITYSAIPVNGGTLPYYQWYVNGISVDTGSAYTFIPANGNVVSVVMTSNASCAIPATATGAVTMTVRANVTPSVTISVAPGTTVCQGTTVELSAASVFGGSSPAYTWELNGNPVGSGSTYSYIPTDGDIIFATMYSNYQCLASNPALSNNIVLHVESNLPPTVTITLNSGANVGSVLYNDTLTAVVTNPGTNTKYQWSVDGVVVPGATSATLVRSSLNNLDQIFCEVTDSNACGNLTGFSTYTVLSANVAVKTVASTMGDIRLVPNPNNGAFTIKGAIGNQADEEVTIEVTNMLGQVIYSNVVMSRGGAIDEKVQMMSSLTNGMYVVTVRTAGDSKVFHMEVAQ